MGLSDIEQENLLMHLIYKAGPVEGRSKLCNIIYLIKADKPYVFSNYEFDGKFLTVRSSNLNDDVVALWNQQYLEISEVYPKEGSLAHTHKIEITQRGKNHLVALMADEKLREALGNDNFKEIENKFRQYNRMPMNELMQLIEARGIQSI